MTNPPVTIIRPGDVAPGPRRASVARRFERAAERRERRGRRREGSGPVNIRLWIPATLIFVLLAPFAVLLAPFLYLAPRRIIESPARTIAALGAVLLSLGGTVVEVDAPDTRLRFRLF